MRIEFAFHYGTLLTIKSESWYLKARWFNICVLNCHFRQNILFFVLEVTESAYFTLEALVLCFRTFTIDRNDKYWHTTQIRVRNRQELIKCIKKNASTGKELASCTCTLPKTVNLHKNNGTKSLHLTLIYYFITFAKRSLRHQ